MRLSPPPLAQPIEKQVASPEWQRWFSAIWGQIGAGAITGSGTANNITMFTGTATIGNAPSFAYNPGDGFYIFSGSGVSVNGTLEVGAGGISATGTIATNGDLKSDHLAGTGTRLVTASTVGALTNATTIDGGYTFTGAMILNSTLNISGLLTSLDSAIFSGSVAAGGGAFKTGNTIVNGSATNRGYVVSGFTAGIQVQIDGQQVQAMNNATPSQLTLNSFGGAVQIASSGNLTTIQGTLAVSQVATFTAKPILSSLTASLPVFSDGSKGLVSNTMTGTGDVVMSAAPTLTGTITGAALTLSGNLNIGGAVDTATYLVNSSGGNIAAARVAGGGGTIASFGVGSPSDIAAGNYELLSLLHTGSGGALIRVLKGGTGVYRDLLISNNGATQITVAAAGGVAIANTLGVTGLSSLSTMNTTGNVGIGTTSSNLNSQTRELVVSAGATGTVNAGISVQGSDAASNVFAQVNFFHKANNVALIGATRDGADNSGTLGFYTASAGVLTRQLVIDKTGAATFAAASVFSGGITSVASLASGFYETGTFTATLTGVSASVTGTAYWTRVGNQVTLLLPGLGGTSTSTSCTITGMSSSIFPARKISKECTIADNGVLLSGAGYGFEIGTSGTITLYLATLAAGFTASGIKGLAATVTPSIGSAFLSISYTTQ